MELTAISAILGLMSALLGGATFFVELIKVVLKKYTYTMHLKSSLAPSVVHGDEVYSKLDISKLVPSDIPEDDINYQLLILRRLADKAVSLEYKINAGADGVVNLTNEDSQKFLLLMKEFEGSNNSIQFILNSAQQNKPEEPAVG